MAHVVLAVPREQVAKLGVRLGIQLEGFVCVALGRGAAAAGEYYNLRIPIEAEAKQGKNWSEVH